MNSSVLHESINAFLLSNHFTRREQFESRTFLQLFLETKVSIYLHLLF